MVLSMLGVLGLVGCGGKQTEGMTPEGKNLALRRCESVFEATSQLECYQKHFEKVRETEGLEQALDGVVDWHNSPDGERFAAYCHEVLHGLGETAMREAGNENARISIFAKSRITCTGGFVHGALTEYYRRIEGREIIKNYKNLCQTLITSITETVGKDADGTGWLSWNCDHMLGHELYKASSEDLVQGAGLCKFFELESDQRYGCEAGFYMEHYLTMGRTTGEGYAKAETIEDVHALCRAVDVEVARGCWSESGGMVYANSDWSWAKSGEACRTQTPDEVMLTACYEGLGRNIPPYAGYEPDQMMADCGELGEVFAVENCAIQIARAMAMELNEVETGRDICQKLVVDEGRLNRCIRGVEETGEQLAGSGFGGGVNVWER